MSEYGRASKVHREATLLCSVKLGHFVSTFLKRKTSRREVTRSCAGFKNSYAAECSAIFCSILTQTTLIKNIINLEKLLRQWEVPEVGPSRFFTVSPKTHIGLKCAVPANYDV